MLHFKLLILFLILFCFVACYKPIPHLTERTGLAYYYLLVYQPEEIRKQQCSQPNAIGYSFGYASQIYCINNKVSEGLIFDANTNAGIKIDTVIPGQSFICQCGSTFNANSWFRGNKAEDNPLAGSETTPIFASSPDTGAIKNTALVYKTHYNQPDNLYCITVCPANSRNRQYQFLKVR
jgi:hypothetical protein